MATKKPRITVTLDHGVYELVSRLAKLQGVSMSSIVSDYLESAYLPMMRVVALIEAAKEAPEDIRRGLREAAESTERELIQALGGALDSFNVVLRASAESSESLAQYVSSDLGGGSGNPAGGGDPQLVTRGSGRGKRVRSGKRGGENG